MNQALEQFVVLAQGDMEGWTDLLFIVVMVFVWLVGALAKAGGRKKKAQQPALETRQQPRREGWQQRLARKAEEMQRAMEAQGRQATERLRRVEAKVPSGQPGPVQRPTPQPPGGRVVVRAGSGGESVMVYERPNEPQVGQTMPETGVGQVTAPTLGPPLSVESSAKMLAPVPEPAGYQPMDVIDYSDPDALRKAILHYEIFGKPVGMRDPSQVQQSF